MKKVNSVSRNKVLKMMKNISNTKSNNSISQYGFRTGRSTTGAVSTLVLTVMNGFEDKLVTSAYFLDISKSFDCVPHQELIRKMKHYSFTKDLITIITSYLSNIPKDINSSRSETVILLSGDLKGQFWDQYYS